MTDYLSATQKALLAKALESADLRRAHDIRPRDTTGPAPLSATQQRFWFLHHLDPTSGHCNTPAAIAIRGELDADALAHALTEIVRRHDVLRTVFPLHDGAPVQLVLPHADAPLASVDLTALPVAEREPSARSIVSDEARRPFDIASDPSLRVSLLRLADDLHWLVIVAHHIIFDTWSLGVFGREMFAFYDALQQHRPPALPLLEIQYADVAAWEQEPAQQERLSRQLSFWKDKMHGACELVRLPLAAPRRRSPAPAGHSEPFSLPHRTVEALAAFSRRAGTSAFPVLLTALAVLLHRYGGDRDLTISSAVGTRKHRVTEPLIGSFTNTLLFRIQLAGNPDFRELLDHVRAVVLEAHDNSDVPFEQVLAALQPMRTLSYTPFAQVMFNVQDADLAITSRSGLAISRLQIGDRGLMQQDLALHVRIADGRLHGLAQFASDLLEPRTVRRLLADYERIIEAMLERPTSRVSELALGRGVSQDGGPAPQVVGPHLAIERHARLRPARVAIACGGQHLTYGELDWRASQLAARLRELGAGPEWRVAVCLDHPASTVLAVLAVLKTGAACVPCNPANSPARIRTTARDAAVRIALTDEAHAALFALPSVSLVRVAPLPSGEEERVNRPKRQPSGPSHADALALILFTSGTTGPPKSVMQTYGGLAHATSMFAAAGGLTADAVLAAAAPVSACFGVIERLAPLAGGGRLVLPERRPSGPAGTSHEEELFGAETIDRQAASVAHASPLQWCAMLEAGWRPSPGFHALCSGDFLGADLDRRLSASGAVVTNLYGAAEMGTHAASIEAPSRGRIAVGGPAGATTAYALDEYLQPVPVGRTGELCVGGPVLARGYLDRPDLTAERFVPDPFSASPGARMCRMRDMVRCGEDGELYVLHPADSPVAVHGSRVTVGEVEAALRLHPATAAAAVTARAAPGGGRRLIAYVTLARQPGAAAPASRTATELREFLRLQLPRSSWPDELFTVDALPLGPNGRVSRADLPDPAGLASRRHDELALPSSAMERAIAEVWTALLAIDRVGVDDDFFDAGGDSLKAQRMIATLERTLHIRIPVYFAFAHPTVARLASEIERLQKITMSDDEELKRVVDGLSDQEVDALLAAATHTGLQPETAMRADRHAQH